MQKVDYNKYAFDRGTPERRKKPNYLKKWGWKILAIGFVIFVGVRMATMETNLNLITTFSVPEGVSLSDISRDGVNFAVVIDGKAVLKATDEKVQPTASTTKMIAALAVLEKKPIEKGEKGEEIEITNEMYEKWAWYLNHNGSNTKVEIGEKISEYDALVSMMLASSNNMADSLAIWAFGSLEEYQKYATEMVKGWELTKTTIGAKDASGYDEGTTSTASELAIVGHKVMEHPILSEIVALKTAEVPVAGEIKNTNKLLGKASISGVKTGYIGDASGYCIISGYKSDEHIITVAVLGEKTREKSFSENLAIVEDLQEKLVDQAILKKGEEVGYYESWWTGKIKVKADEDFSEMNYKDAETGSEILVNTMRVKIGAKEYEVALDVPEFKRSPGLVGRFLHVFGWKK